ncbi:MAG: aldolase [Methanolinea sp.]|nr:aldolase [Methanolinea sp.]
MKKAAEGVDTPVTDVAAEFARVGRRLVRERLVAANFGNMSVRTGDGFLVTRTGSFLDEPGEPVFVPLAGEIPPGASSESRLHREVYRRTPHGAIVHAHPVHAVALSLSCGDRVVPRDSEGQMFAPEIPVVGGAPGSAEMAGNVAEALTRVRVAIVRGHGTFAAAGTLREAYVLTSLAEHSCAVLLLSGLAGSAAPPGD